MNSDAEDIVAIKRSAAADLLKKKGVHGVSVGYKEVNGQPTADIAIIIHVHKKQRKDEIARKDLVPELIDGILTDVVACERPSPEQRGAKHDYPPRVWYRPLIGGLKILQNKRAGTLGCIAVHNRREGTFILTNQHVLEEQEDVYQPTNDKNYQIASGSDIIQGLTETTDAAAAKLVDGALVDPFWINSLTLPINGIIKVRTRDLDRRVVKSGMATEVTQGRIKMVDREGYAQNGRYFKKQIEIWGEKINAPFSNKGDSGSVVIISGEKICALIWGGGYYMNYNKKYTLASPIEHVQDVLDIKVCFIGGPSPQTYQREASALASNTLDERSVAEIAEQDLRESEMGRRLWSLYLENLEEAAALIHKDQEVSKVWNRTRGQMMVNALLGRIKTRFTVYPHEICGRPVDESLRSIFAALAARGTEDLKTAVDEVLPLALNSIGMSWEQFLGEL